VKRLSVNFFRLSVDASGRIPKHLSRGQARGDHHSHVRASTVLVSPLARQSNEPSLGDIEEPALRKSSKLPNTHRPCPGRRSSPSRLIRPCSRKPPTPPPWPTVAAVTSTTGKALAPTRALAIRAPPVSRPRSASSAAARAPIHRASPIKCVRSMKARSTLWRHTSTQHNNHSRQSTAAATKEFPANANPGMDV
jgi:hypothetical protein